MESCPWQMKLHEAFGCVIQWICWPTLQTSSDFVVTNDRSRMSLVILVDFVIGFEGPVGDLSACVRRAEPPRDENTAETELSRAFCGDEVRSRSRTGDPSG